VTRAARIAARGWCLVREQGPDKDSATRDTPVRFEVSTHTHSCAARCSRLWGGEGARPDPRARSLLGPPKVCAQSAVTIAPDIGARHRQDLAFGSPQWAQTYAAYRNTIGGTNGYLKDTAHESLASPGRRSVRGIAFQSRFVGLLLHGRQRSQDRRLSGPDRGRRRTSGGRAGPTSADQPDRAPAATTSSHLIRLKQGGLPKRRVCSPTITRSSTPRTPIGPP
jgi:hypothetical protein